MLAQQHQPKYLPKTTDIYKLDVQQSALYSVGRFIYRNEDA